MTDEMNRKVGVLKYVAGTKGLKFEDEPNTWYNPVDDTAKADVKKEYEGKTVELVLADGSGTKFQSFMVLDGIDDPVPVGTEETVEDKALREHDEEERSREEKDEKVSPAPLPKEEKEEGTSPVLMFGDTNQYTQDAYKEMEQTKLETAKKGTLNLTYASWAECWSKLKKLHPTSTVYVHENKNGMPFFYDEKCSEMGGFVKVSVTVLGLIHTVHLPIMDHSNKSIPLLSMTTFDINKNIMRAIAKCIAYHGLGLYVFKGEDLKDL